VNEDWWNASPGISPGIAAGSVELGFKLFGLTVDHQDTAQTIIGNPQYAGAPDPDGSRPWLPFTSCSDVKPVSSTT
jgi:hypothetical protein